MVCGTTSCRMAGNPSRVAVKRRKVVGLQGEDRRWSISVGPVTKSSPFRHFQGQTARFQGRRRRNIHTDQIRKSLGGFSKISRHTNRNKITVRCLDNNKRASCAGFSIITLIHPSSPSSRSSFVSRFSSHAAKQDSCTTKAYSSVRNKGDNRPELLHLSGKF